MCVFVCLAVQAHTSTFLYFEDKDGLIDSLEIAVGLSDEEIDAIPIFSEEEVQFTSENNTHWVWLDNPKYSPELKYYVSNFCRIYAYKPWVGTIHNGYKPIYIPKNHLPVTISWDKDFFEFHELTGSLLSDMPSWFDAGCEESELVPYLLMADNSSCILHDTYTDGCTYQYMKDIYVKILGISVGTKNNGEGLEIPQDDVTSVSKHIRDGQVLIERNGSIYTITGQQLK